MNLTQIQNELAQKPNRRELVIFGLVLFMGVIVFFRSCYSPSNTAISGAKKEIAALRGEAASASSASAKPQLPVWNGSDAQRRIYENFARTLGADPDARLIRTFSNPNMQQGLKLINIELPVDQGARAELKQKFKVSLSGPFDGVGEYIQRMASLQMLMIIDKVTMTLTDEESGRINADIEGVVYGWN